MKIERKQGEFKPIAILLENQEDLNFMLDLAKGGVYSPWDPLVIKSKSFYKLLRELVKI